VPTVSLTADPMAPSVGQSVTLTITVSQTNGPVAGFYLIAESNSPGTFKAIETGTLASANGVTHTMPRTGANGVTTFKVAWSASAPTGVLFNVYALSGNGDGTSSGDGAGSASLSIASGCVSATYYRDQDGDGFGTTDPAAPTRIDCTKPFSFAAVTGDCDDFSERVYPGAPELCDQKDNNCDGQVDEAVVYQNYCEDKDGDGHGVLGLTTTVDCKPVPGFAECLGDCNDYDATVYPRATEICDGRDNNCNGQVDEGVRKSCGVGRCLRYADSCTGACVPGQPTPETCNFLDDDCDGQIDDAPDGQLCGASGLVCVLSSCIPGVSPDGGGGAPAAGTGGGPGSSSATGGSGGGGGGGVGGGRGGRGGGDASAAREASGGCSMLPIGARWPSLIVAALCVLLTARGRERRVHRSSGGGRIGGPVDRADECRGRGAGGRQL
jgi:hypothetical protein